MGDLPFDVAELPTFDRKTWTRLATHRYQFQVAPKEDERAECSEALLSQLRYAFGISAFDSGLEPSIAYPTVAHTIHRFVDITFYSKEHHDRARNALLHWKTVKLTPWLHAAYVPHPWFPIQFTYPKEYVHNHADFFPKVHAALVRSDFGKMGKLVAAWVMPNGYPHSVDFIPQRGERDEQPSLSSCSKANRLKDRRFDCRPMSTSRAHGSRSIGPIVPNCAITARPPTTDTSMINVPEDHEKPCSQVST